MLVMSFLFQKLSEATYFHRHVRRFFADYGMPISLVATSGMAYWGRFSISKPTTLPVGAAFQAAGGREWLVRFWQLDGKWVGIAFPFGMILWVLFFFDHNVSVSYYLNHSCNVSHLTWSLVSHRTELTISLKKASRLSLRLLPSGDHNIHCRTHWRPRSKWSHTPSSNTHNLASRNGSPFEEGHGR